MYWRRQAWSSANVDSYRLKNFVQNVVSWYIDGWIFIICFLMHTSGNASCLSIWRFVSAAGEKIRSVNLDCDITFLMLASLRARRQLRVHIWSSRYLKIMSLNSAKDVQSRYRAGEFGIEITSSASLGSWHRKCIYIKRSGCLKQTCSVQLFKSQLIDIVLHKAGRIASPSISIWIMHVSICSFGMA